MKVAVCSTGDSLDSPVDARLGRCAGFVVVETDTFEASAVANPGSASEHGAGVQAAQVICSLGVAAVIAKHFSPHACEMLFAAGIDAYACDGETVRNAVNLLNAGALKQITKPTAPARCGMGGGRGMGRLGRGARANRNAAQREVS